MCDENLLLQTHGGHGGAPCVQEDLLSLAICKPMIRSTAECDDLIFGFTANSLDVKNRFIYIARVTDKNRNGAYYKDKDFTHRADCIYESHADRFCWREGALHHGPGDLEHDLGTCPNYAKANVLLSKDFRYFGVKGTADYRSAYPEINKAVENLGRGHRVNHPMELQCEFLALKRSYWDSYPQNVIGEPTSTPRRGVCHRNRSCGVLDADIQHR